MHGDVWCDKILCGTNLCNQRLTRIIRINKLTHKFVSLWYIINTKKKASSVSVSKNVEQSYSSYTWRQNRDHH